MDAVQTTPHEASIQADASFQIQFIRAHSSSSAFAVGPLAARLARSAYLGGDLVRQRRQLGGVGHAALAMRSQRRAGPARNDVEMQVEHGLSRGGPVEL